jgi:protein TonB
MVTVSLLVFLWPDGRAPLEDAVLSEALDRTLTEPQPGESSLRETASDQEVAAQAAVPSVAPRSTRLTVQQAPDATRPAGRDPAPAPTTPAEENDQRVVSGGEPSAELRADWSVPRMLPSGVTALPLPFEPLSGELRPDVITEPVLIARVDPRYPDIAKRLSIRGDVVLRVLVGPDGSVTPVEVLTSPHSSLSDAAKRAVQQWRYRPALRNGVPVSSHAEIKMTFRLE